MAEDRPRRRRRSVLPLPKVEVEYLILADAAEALGGKLYLMGGGWDTIRVANFDVPVQMAIACGILVPWNETDDDHQVALTLRDLDGKDIAPPLEVSLKTGRAASLPKGASTHVPIAVKASLKLPGPGTYTVTAIIDGDLGRARGTQFHAAGAGPVV